VPEISRFLGIRIYMYFAEHLLGLVVEWARLHRGELEANWMRARSTEPLVPIEPLG
jgi:hypothetical protein